MYRQIREGCRLFMNNVCGAEDEAPVRRGGASLSAFRSAPFSVPPPYAQPFQRLCVQLDGIPIVQDMTRVDLLGVKDRLPPDPSVLEAGCDVLVDHACQFADGAAGG